jgi:hypothetical protein
MDFYVHPVLVAELPVVLRLTILTWNISLIDASIFLRTKQEG